jgi:hypothetical protein
VCILWSQQNKISFRKVLDEIMGQSSQQELLQFSTVRERGDKKYVRTVFPQDNIFSPYSRISTIEYYLGSSLIDISDYFHPNHAALCMIFDMWFFPYRGLTLTFTAVLQSLCLTGVGKFAHKICG